jgi:hypothetical protein
MANSADAIMASSSHRPGAETASTFAASRLAMCSAQLSDAEHAEVVSWLGWAAEELGYPARP